ncbi:hypothetical protein D3C87_1293240 [compost metagenome]
MKLLIPVLLLFASSAQALQADRFECTVSLKDYDTNQVVEHVQEFDMARISLSASPAPDIRLTGSRTSMRLSLDLPNAVVNSDVVFYYKHAVRLDDSLKPVDARQFACVAIGMRRCAKPAGTDPNCYDTEIPQVVCKEPKNPFDPLSGWTPTSLIGGVPMFNDRGSGSATAESVQGNSRVVTILNCKFKGTYW